MKSTFSKLLLLATFAFFLLAASPVKAGQNGTTLSADPTAAAHWSRAFAWTIDKSVTPDTLNMFQGDSGTAHYTVALTKDGGTDQSYIDGQICVTNGGAIATENLAIIANVTKPPSSTILASENVDVSGHPVLISLETYCYSYNINVPATSGATYKVTADITITNHSGHLGNAFGPSPSATTSFPTTPVLVNDSVNVNDTNGSSWQFSQSGSQTYDKTFSCDGDGGVHDNTATIQETQQSDSASVTVNCFDLTVNKTASTGLTRTYAWNINKVADQSSLTLALNEAFTVNYTVGVNSTGSADSNWMAHGNITVHNPAPMAATINSISDVVSGAGSFTPDCGVTFPYTLAAGADLVCTYSGSLPDASTRTNTATATLQNTPSGTTDFSGTASVDFASAAVTSKDTCVSVNDSFGLSLGTVCNTDTLPKTFTYSHSVGPYTTCGPYTVDNTATFTAADTGTTGSSSVRVGVNVPCVLGCTLTIGYWKNHTGLQKGPQADMVTPLLPKCLGKNGAILGTCDGKAVNVNSTSIAYPVLGMSYNGGAPSNGITKLYAQLLASKLNVANGANSSSIASVITSADNFLTSNDQSAWKNLSKTQQNQALSWMTALDNYNNGITGPGHCSQ